MMAKSVLPALRRSVVRVAANSGFSGGVPAPTISGLNYDQGQIEGGGASIVLTGTNLTGATAVTFLGTSSVFTVDSSVQITATLPAHAAGTGNIQVTTPGGSATIAFEYWTPASLTKTSWHRNFPGAPPWPDLSGNARDIVSSGFNPTAGTALGGYGTADFSGGIQYLNCGANNNVLFSAAGTTFWCLFNPDTAPTAAGADYNDGNLFTDNGNAETTIGFTSLGLSASFYDGAFKRINAALSAGSWVLGMVTHDGSTLKVYINGSAPSTIACGNLPFLSPSVFQVGRSYGGAVLFDGRIAEIGTMNTAISDQNRVKVRKYLNQRHGLALA